MSILHKLQWRYAVRKFDQTKNVSEEQITELLKATNLSASALGLQPYEFIIIHDKELQKELQGYSRDQVQIGGASHLIVFATKTEISEDYVLEYIARTEKIRGFEPGGMDDYKKLIFEVAASKTKEDIFHWTQKQAYLALGTLLVAAADLQIDVCPIELINAEKYNKALGLDEQNLHACVVATVGYRSLEDTLHTKPKSRRHLDDITQLRY